MIDVPMEYWDMAAAMIHNYDVSDMPEDKQRHAVRLIEAGDEEGLATMLWSMDQECQKMFGENTMKLSKRQLKKIIREEKIKLISETRYASHAQEDQAWEEIEQYFESQEGNIEDLVAKWGAARVFKQWFEYFTIIASQFGRVNALDRDLFKKMEAIFETPSDHPTGFDNPEGR